MSGFVETASHDALALLPKDLYSGVVRVSAFRFLK